MRTQIDTALVVHDPHARTDVPTRWIGRSGSSTTAMAGSAPALTVLAALA